MPYFIIFSMAGLTDKTQALILTVSSVLLGFGGIQVAQQLNLDLNISYLFFVLGLIGIALKESIGAWQKKEEPKIA